MLYYLLDSSALLLRYLHHKSLLDQMYVQKLKKEAFFYFPSFCVPEIFNSFARLRYREGKLTEKEYSQYCNTFRGEIKNRHILYAYDLHRYHNYNADLIYEVEHTTAPLSPTQMIKANKCSLSALDLLIIAMGMELRRIHSKDKVYVITNDERLASISNARPNLFAPAIYLEKATQTNMPTP
ncbi:MAG: hypothetical protein HYY91_04910 [Candidatus Omnitrophica bacterium]|nr:hypothetical protein [Candidatus Omnitrophota bacterium]